MIRYRSLVMDNQRWQGFEHRPGDIVISTPPKCGTTWTQMLVALLVFDGPEFPGPLEHVSPWLDMCNRRIDDVRADLAAQSHRRFIKTHTPLDGLPLEDGVTYVVVGRDPRDVAVSFEHHRANMDLEHFIELRAEVMGLDDLAELGPPPPDIADPSERMRAFIRGEGFGSLAAVLHHFDDAWHRRDTGNVLMVHYADLTADLPGELVRMASALGIPLTSARAAELAAEATLDGMRARADELAPAASLRNWKDTAAFFRTGGSGEWRERMSDADTVEYDARVDALVAADVGAWAHHGRRADRDHE